ncbi:MAG: hypothetical protein AAB474_00530 [Patescibacteria group bacterium]
MEILRNKKNLRFGFLAFLIILPSLIFLVSRSAQIESWDNWNWGSAQTMLTVRYWARDGFLKHRMFFLLNGYHPEIEILDKPEFRFLTGNTLTGGLVGNRLYYNHYPSNYVIPYGLLGKLGVENRFWFRMLSVVFSFGSVLFLAGFIYILTNYNRWIALIAVFYYITSSSFISYADSLNNTPLDDFFKLLILFLSAYYWKIADSAASKRRLKSAIWILYFILASVSLDSTFFVFFWLGAFNFMETKKFNFKEYFYWAAAPLSAFIIQFTQNTFYLGFKNAMLDLWGDFLYRFSEAPAALDNLPPIIKSISAAFSTAGYFSDMRTRFAIPLILLLVYFLFKEKDSKHLLRYGAILAVSGSIHPFIFPVAGTFGYQGRQMAPALLLIFGLAAWKLLKKIKEKQFSLHFFALLFCAIAFWAAHFSASFSYTREWPNNVFPKEDIVFLQNLNKISDSSTMILRIKPDIAKVDRSLEDFYADRLIISFKNIDVLLEYMDRIYSTIPGKVNFLLVLPGQEYQPALEKLKNMDDFSAADAPVVPLIDDFKIIKVIHK